MTDDHQTDWPTFARVQLRLNAGWELWDDHGTYRWYSPTKPGFDTDLPTEAEVAQAKAQDEFLWSLLGDKVERPEAPVTDEVTRLHDRVQAAYNLLGQGVHVENESGDNIAVAVPIVAWREATGALWDALHSSLFVRFKQERSP